MTSSFDVAQVAQQAIGLFLEYRDQHGRSVAEARLAAVAEVVEGLSTVLPGEDVRALPPEPELGRTVKIIAGDFVGMRWTHQKFGIGSAMWYPDPDQNHVAQRHPRVWRHLLDLAGPAGVLVLDGA